MNLSDEIKEAINLIAKIAFVSALFLFSGYMLHKMQHKDAFAATIQTPNAVRITNDGYNNVTSTVTGTSRTLDVRDPTSILWSQYLWSALTGSNLNVIVNDGTDTLDVDAATGGIYSIIVGPTGNKAIVVQATNNGVTAANMGLWTNSRNYAINGSGTFDRLLSVNSGQLVITQKNSIGTEVEIDDEGTQVTIDEAHHHVHEGNYYTIAMVASIASGTTLYCQLTTPDSTVRIHFTKHCKVSGNGAVVTLYEAPTSTGGTLITPVNRNRASGNSATATFSHSVSVSDTGTQIDSEHLESGLQGGEGIARDEEEWIGAQNTKYLIAITCDSGTACTFSGKLNWYEE